MPLISQNKAIKKYDLSGASLLIQNKTMGMKQSPMAIMEISRFSTGNRPVFKGKSLGYNSVKTSHFIIGKTT